MFVTLGCCGLLAHIVYVPTIKAFREIPQARLSVKRLEVSNFYFKVNSFCPIKNTYNLNKNNVFQEFFQLEEFQRLNIQISNSEHFAVRFSDVKANWTEDSSRDTIHDFNLTIKRNELTTIIGQVGSGKVGYCTNLLTSLKTVSSNLDPLFVAENLFEI